MSLVVPYSDPDDTEIIEESPDKKSRSQLKTQGFLPREFLLFLGLKKDFVEEFMEA